MSEGIQPSKLTIDVVRLKKLPQTEDEPLACSASVQIICLDSPNTLHFVSDTQKNTNNPYFNQTIDRDLPSALNDIPTLNFLVEIVEHQRQSNATVILFSSFTVDQDVASHTTGKTELSLILTTVNPLERPDVARAEEDKIRNSSDAPTLVIRYKLTAPKAIKPVYDPNADVVLDFMPELTGDHRLVPDVAPLAWFNLIADPLWCEKFSACVVETWKSLPSLSVQIRRMSGGEALLTSQPKKPGSAKGGATPRGGSAGGGGAGGIKTMGDVITQAWVCKRNHQLLSRLRLTAEKFATGDPSLAFTIEEEIEWKKYWKERAVLRMQQCRKSFETSGSTDKVRTLLDRLWMLMAAGIPADGPAPNLGFDVRHKLNQATFTTSSAEILLTCLTNRLVPWLTYQECEVLCKDDADPRSLPSSVRGAVFPAVVTDAKAAHLHAFVDVMASFVGRIVDTLTDAEFLSALEYFVPAVREAHMRASGSAAGADAALGGSTKKSRSGSAKKGKKEKGSPAASPEKGAGATAAAAAGGAAAAPQGAGLAMKHLDNLGRRTDDPKFA